MSPFLALGFGIGNYLGLGSARAWVESQSGSCFFFSLAVSQLDRIQVSGACTQNLSWLTVRGQQMYTVDVSQTEEEGENKQLVPVSHLSL